MKAYVFCAFCLAALVLLAFAPSSAEAHPRRCYRSVYAHYAVPRYYAPMPYACPGYRPYGYSSYYSPYAYYYPSRWGYYAPYSWYGGRGVVRVYAPGVFVGAGW